MSEPLHTPSIVAGRYDVHGVLSNSGGCGVIYKARDRFLRDRDVLIKARRYPPELFATHHDEARTETIERLRRETLFEWQMLVYFRETENECRIPVVHDVVHDASVHLAGPHRDRDGAAFTLDDDFVRNEPYIVLQNIPGQNLETYAEQERKHAHWESRVLVIALQLATILSRFHRPNPAGQYFIYQDLKPANVMISYDRFVTLIDFGGITVVGPDPDDPQGRLRSQWGEKGSPDEGSYGHAGLGTPGFKPPEMEFESAHLDGTADIYTLGATMFALLTGQEISRTQPEYGPIDSGALDGGGWREDLIELIRRALAPDPMQRVPTMQGMREALAETLKSRRT